MRVAQVSMNHDMSFGKAPSAKDLRQYAGWRIMVLE